MDFCDVIDMMICFVFVLKFLVWLCMLCFVGIEFVVIVLGVDESYLCGEDVVVMMVRLFCFKVYLVIEFGVFEEYFVDWMIVVVCDFVFNFDGCIFGKFYIVECVW